MEQTIDEARRPGKPSYLPLLVRWHENCFRSMEEEGNTCRRQPMTNPKMAYGHSMSARASETRDEVSRLDKSSLSQMQVRLVRWGVLLGSLEGEMLAAGGNRFRENSERIADLKESYRTTRLGFDQLKATGLPQWEAFVHCFLRAWSEFEATALELRNQASGQH